MRDLSDYRWRIGFLGAGNMASALVQGIVKAGLNPAKISVTDLDAAKAERLAREFGVGAVRSAEEVCGASELIVVAVKPGAVVPLLTSLRETTAGKLVLSIAAGVTVQALQEASGSGARVLRAMPNAAALVGAGATALCAGLSATPADLESARALLEAVGSAETVIESQMDAVTGLSGSGPAYLMLAIEALADGGVHAGLPRDVALRLAAQTVKGAGQLVLETGKHPAELKDAVTSPGGTTIAGIEVLERGGLRAALMQAVLAGAARSRELAKG